MLTKKWASFMLLFYAIPSFAFFCPTNFNQINIGDSIEQVTQQCGKPDSEATQVKKEEGPEEWSYYIPQTVSGNASTPTQGTLKTQITFDANGKAINISVNGIGVGESDICGTSIQLGSTREEVKSACGDPSFINKQNKPSTDTQQGTKITTFTYSGNSPATLVFTDGKLVERK